MPVSTENIRRWIEQSDIDYYTYFIKAWIPFNAWYNANYENDGDRAKINAVKSNSPYSRVGKAIQKYMEDDGHYGVKFRSYLASFHHALSQNELEGREGRILFTEIVIERNPENCINETYDGCSYYLKREDKQRLQEIKKIKVLLKRRNGVVKFQYEHSEYSISHFRQSFEGLSSRQEEKLLEYFEALEPTIQYSAIADDDDDESYECDNYNFVKDENATNCDAHIIVKAIIESLYQLRNMLFHGELTPSDDVQEVYQYAYYILKMILEKIKQ